MKLRIGGYLTTLELKEQAVTGLAKRNFIVILVMIFFSVAFFVFVLFYFHLLADLTQK